MTEFRMTAGVARVVRVFLDDPAAPVYGFDLMQRTRFPSGTIYPILARLERAGWITGQLEAADDASREGRPARRLYRMTADGAVAGRLALAELTAQLQPGASPVLRPHRQLGQA
jgi:PadR family transcriptional regulator, regulatory protein PadR